MSGAFSLAGRTALVTGANTGLGQALAVALGQAGAAVICAGRSAMDDTLRQLERAGAKCTAVAADLSVPGSPAKLMDKALGWNGRVDILVNNAGIIRRADALDFTEQDWDDVLDVNLKSAFFLSQAAARAMIDAGRGGKIINVASMLSFQGGIRVASYTASKSGLAGLTKLLACEWAARGINVNAVAPGYFVTSNTEAIRSDATREQQILARIPAERWGEPEDLGGAVVFLASDAARYVHGAILPVDGGWLAR